MIFNSAFGQRVEKEFYFNSKKFVKEYHKSVEKNKVKIYPLRIIDIEGNDIIFDVFETQISEEKILNIYTFKGKSKNGDKLISFTISKSGLTGSYSDNTREIYIEPVSKNCKKHVVYFLNTKKQEVGQINDYVR